MLSRSGLSIRKFIPHRRFSVGVHDEQEDIIGVEMKNEDSNLVSWADQDNSGSVYVYAPATANRHSPNRKRRVPTPIIATSPLTHNDILRPLPPLPSETPRSSPSSSCRCERHAECDCPLLRRRSHLYSLSSSSEDTNVEDSTLGLNFNNYTTDDIPNHHRIPKSRFFLSGDSSQSKEDETARPLSSEGGQKDKRPKESHVDEHPHQGFSEDVQQFMQEADDAFKAIGSTLTEVQPIKRAISPTITKPKALVTEHKMEETPPTPPPKEIVMTHSKSPPDNVRSSFSPSPDSSPKSDSPSKFKRRSKTSKETKSMKATRKLAAVKSGPRWTLSENVSDLLTGMFHKIEADEMLTPAQIEAYKQRRLTKLQQAEETEKTEKTEKATAEALENDSTDTPTEPFHLDDLPSRIGSAGIKDDLEPTTEDHPTITFSEDFVHSNFNFEEQYTNHLSSSPTPPMISSRRRWSASRKTMAQLGLPSIPETTTLERPTNEAFEGFFFDEEPDDPLDPNSEYLYLPSSAFSLTTPKFRHGPIRIPKPDLVPDTKLDWTAFQMAILGGAGDWYSDSDDTLRRREAEDIADIVEWWESWEFASTGDLVTHDCEASSPTSTLSGDEIPDITYTEIESDNPYRQHHEWQEVQTRGGVEGLHIDFDYAQEEKEVPSSYFPEPLVIGNKWGLDGKQKQAINRDSIHSLPPSPMLDLRVIRAANGNMDVVPMGYNLGHDLGDFLKWEAEHAYAGAFNTPTGVM